MDGVIIMRPIRLALTQRVRFMTPVMLDRKRQIVGQGCVTANQMDTNDDRRLLYTGDQDNQLVLTETDSFEEINHRCAVFYPDSPAFGGPPASTISNTMSKSLVHNVQGGPKKRYPCFNFAITSVNVHRF